MWVAEKVEKKKPDELNAYASNARVHTEQQIQQIANSISEWGWTIPILIYEENTVLAGHGRLTAAKSLNIDEVPCIVAEGWSDAQKKAYVIADNKLAENSEWDTGLYFSELKELSNLGFDISLTGLDQELGALSFAPNLNPETHFAEITSQDIESASETVGQIAPSGTKVVELTCPHCGKDFEFSGM